MKSNLKKSSLQLAERITNQTGPEIGVIDFNQHIKQLKNAEDENSIDKFIQLYKKLIEKLEKNLWQNNISEKNLENYRTIFRALEKVQQLKANDERFNFKIIIPVADRPQHLEQCLNSLLKLCHNYEYGLKDGQFTKISVLIADDSKDEHNIKQHQALCRQFTDAGITTDYFSLNDQLAMAKQYAKHDNSLKQIISDIVKINNIKDFSHKGASVMRNITYLKLVHDIKNNLIASNTLFYFIDSDQEFCVNTTYSDKKHYAINYFHYLNEIFKTQDINILTGKVVGDPPVSPSVMANNFQQDVKNFISAASKLKPHDTCQFHQQENNKKNDDAAYHDMADLFGFNNQKRIFDYHCTLKNEHNNADCFSDFSNKLEHFFYGEHPTRKTFFNYEQGFTNTSAARTVYTGNYVITANALKYFIPFATLKLRMAGPVLGRILKSELQHRFASANLPMLHNRTIEATGQSEFRPGVEKNNHKIDLANEFIRQFYGDIMLFAIEELCDKGYPQKTISEQTVRYIIEATYNKIRKNYIEKHDAILQLKTQIHNLLDDKNNWWSTGSNPSDILNSLKNFHNFLENIESNFDNNTQAYLQINSDHESGQQLELILQAILCYQDDAISWNNTVSL